MATIDKLIDSEEKYLMIMQIKILFMLIVAHVSCKIACAQDQTGAFGLVDKISKITEPSVANSIGGFSLWGLLGGLIFGSIGFVSFVYGKRMSKLYPLIIGIVLIVSPYFLRNTMALYLAGALLTAILFLTRKR